MSSRRKSVSLKWVSNFTYSLIYPLIKLISGHSSLENSYFMFAQMCQIEICIGMAIMRWKFNKPSFPGKSDCVASGNQTFRQIENLAVWSLHDIYIYERLIFTVLIIKFGIRCMSWTRGIQQAHGQPERKHQIRKFPILYSFRVFLNHSQPWIADIFLIIHSNTWIV